TYNAQLPCPSTLFVGQPFVLTFGVVGFDRVGAMKQPNVTLELRIVDEAGKATMAKPISDTAKEADAKLTILPCSFDLPLTRPGKFTIEVTATDNNTRKTSAVKLPLTVAEAQQK